MNSYRVDPRKQFSKRLARWTSIFWFIFMTWLSVLFIIVPEAALYCVYMAIIATSVMLLNVWAYTRNSIYEKGVFAMLDKTKMSLTIGGKQPQKSDDETDTEDENEETEGGGNG